MTEKGVFYHIGGVMMDDEYKRRQWENDAPGWYFWRFDNGLQRLYGPYDSRELAQDQVDAFACTAVSFFPRLVQRFPFFSRSGQP